MKMETPNGFMKCNAVPFEKVLPILANSKRLKEKLKSKFLPDEINNEAEKAWTRYIRSDDLYPVWISEYEGVFFGSLLRTTQ